MADHDAKQRLGRFNDNRLGRAKKAPHTQLVTDVLEDGQWHLVSDLVQLLMDSELPLPRESRGRYVAARVLVREIARRAIYEIEHKDVGKTRVYHRVRRNPVVVPGATLRTCQSCGRAKLNKTTRVRRVTEFRIPNEGKGSGDRRVARFKSVYLCIPCAEEELAAKGETWIIAPPFFASGDSDE